MPPQGDTYNLEGIRITPLQPAPKPASYECKRDTFYEEMRPGHVVMHEGGAISFVEDDPFKKYEEPDYEKQLKDSIEAAVGKALEPLKEKQPKQYEEVIPL